MIACISYISVLGVIYLSNQYVCFVIFCSVDTSNGISSQESGALKKGLNGETGEQGEAIAVKGTIQWTAPDGQVFQLSYIADENGFQPTGVHLPTPPPAQ